jgi:hypothetical protein
MAKKTMKHAAKKLKPAPSKKYIQSPGQLGTGVLPVTPPLTSEQARKQLRGF